MEDFLLETGVIAAAVLLSMAYAIVRSRDSLHPAIVLGPLVLFIYVWMPLDLYSKDGFRGFLTGPQLGFAQLVQMTGVLALLLGVHVGAGGARFVPGNADFSADRGPRLFKASIAVGVLGVIGYVVMVAGGGGVEAAYGRAYGGGTTEYGYIRSLDQLTVPGMLMLIASGEPRRSLKGKLWLLAFVLPFLLHGVLGARRGPTFLVFVTLAAGYFLVYKRRPRLLTVLGGGALLGGLMLFLVHNRSQIYLGSDFEKVEFVPTRPLEAAAGNEFIYGAGFIVASDAVGRFTWGGRYATVLFVRPIPRALWPTKYRDAAAFFGTNIELNMGINIHLLDYVLGWTGAIGAAPGIVADMWYELSWGMLLALYFFGWLYGRAWRGAVTQGGFATIVYGAFLSLSVYLIMQTLEAALFRALFMLGPAWVAWRWAMKLPAQSRAQWPQAPAEGHA